MSKRCSECGRDLKRFNLEFSREIKCDRCTIGEMRAPWAGEPPTLGAEVDNLQRLFEQVKEGKQSVLAIKFFEYLLDDDFKNTKEFVNKVTDYFNGGFLRGDHLKHFRKSKQWTQSLMAIKLECGQHYVSDMESGRKPLNIKAKELLLRQDLWHWAWPRTHMAAPPKMDSKTVLQTNKLRAKTKPVLGTLSPELTVGKRLRCWRCRELKDDLDIIVETLSPHRTEYVCEDCYRSKGGGK